jgi:uncharacterized protein involved in outer membrane biogenesis
MKLRNSPVFHFGILLVVLVVGLLLAPFVINWNSYRVDLEEYGRKLTGRAVIIEGPVSARLFPWPRLSADAVRITNPPGLSGPDFAAAKRVTIRMTLAGLLQGNLDVESIDVEEPVINLERRAEGDNNWELEPAVSLMAGDVLSRVRLDKISFTGGTVRFHDGRRGETIRLGNVQADAASPGLDGPWRFRGSGDVNGHVVDFALNTGRYVAGEPFMFGVKLSAADHSGYVFSFDGARDSSGVSGDIRVEPAASDDGKTDAEGRIRPFLFSARVAGDFDRLSLTKIELSKLEANATSPIITGSAELQLGQRILAAVKLDASILDLDEMAGAKSRSLLRQAGSLAVVDSLLGQLPADMTLTGSLAVTALKLDGHSFDAVSLDLEAKRERFNINRFSAGLPGRSAMLLSGHYVPGPGGGELAGELAFETSDLRDFTMWLWPGGRQKLEGLWRGDRGRFKMQTGLNMTSAKFRLSPIAFELDGAGGSGSIAINAAGRRSVDLELETDRLDLDAYAPQGVQTFAVAAEGGAGALFGFLLPQEDIPDLQIKMKAGEVQLNGVMARDVAIDLQSSASGLDLRALRIGAVGGASVEAAGLVLDAGRGADGTLNLNVSAQDPRELLKLLGFGAGDSLPPWAQQLGPSSLRCDLGISPGSEGSRLDVKLEGKSGDINVSGKASAVPGGKFSADLSLDAPNSRPILSLFAMGSETEDGFPGSLAVKAEGRSGDDLETSVVLQALGARIVYGGRMDLRNDGLGLDGQLNFGTTDAAPLLRAAGFPVAVSAGTALVAETPVNWTGGRWDMPEISGRFGLQQFSGSLSLSPEHAVEGRLSTGSFSLIDLLATAFLDWSGVANGLETIFAERAPLGLKGQISVMPDSLLVYPGLVLVNPEIGLELQEGSVQLVMQAKDAAGDEVAVDLRSEGRDASRRWSAALGIPVELSGPMTLADGTVVIEGRGRIDLIAEGAGRSPAATMAAMQGQGSYEFETIRLAEVSAAEFARSLARASDAEDVSRTMASLRSGDGLTLGAVSGQITLTGGEMRVTSIERNDSLADVTVEALADLVQGGIDVEVMLRPKSRPGLPAMSIVYAGPPGALVRTEDASALETALGVNLMQQGLAELERLQEEQARLLRLEEEQRREDEVRLQAYYAQRDELLLRRRELRVHGELQAIAADRLRRRIEAERAANAEINKSEIRQRLREMKTWRRLAQNAGPPAATAKQPASRPPRAPAKPEPVILEKPPGAPVIISPAPGSPPSQ